MENVCICHNLSVHEMNRRGDKNAIESDPFFVLIAR